MYIAGSLLRVAEKFTYIDADAELFRSTLLATPAFGTLRSRIWSEHGIRTATQCKVYRAVVLSGHSHCIDATEANLHM